MHSLAQFTDFVETRCLDQTEFLFRGQRRVQELIPGIARHPPTRGEIPDFERSMLDEFQRYSVPYLRVTPPTLWHWLALAQHHGLPTRLLDWSLNPLTALWFAVHQPPEDGRDGVVWMLEPRERDFPTEGEMDSLECTRHMLFSPRHVTERITAQSGWFTVHRGTSSDPRFEPLETSSQFAGRLTRLMIPAGRFAHFRFHLDRVGVNHASVFPGLDGISKYIAWRTFYLRDEMPA